MPDDGQLQFAIAGGNVDITPRDRVPLAGYRALRKAVFDTIADELEANVLVLRPANEPPVVLVSVDLLYAGAHICNRIFEALAGRVSRERILVAASHTHFAPATQDSLPELGRVEHEYRDFAAARIIDLLERLLAAAPVPARCRYHEGAALHSVNRRRTRFGISRRYPFFGFHTDICPNESGPRDDLIRALTLTDSDGRINAICWSFACHPNTLPHIDSVSAEYPGRVREFLRRRFGAIPVLFWQGFSGNINPYRMVQPSGSAGGRGPQFVRPTISQWERWADGLSEVVQLAVSTPGKPVGGPVVCQVRSMSVDELGLRSDRRLIYRKLSFGSDLAVCGLSAEVAVEYIKRLRMSLPSTTVIPVGCTEDVFGYLPADEMIGEGGYEVRGFLRRFDLRGGFRRDVSEIVERRLLLPEDRRC
jgi:hypothetical protein